MIWISQYINIKNAKNNKQENMTNRIKLSLFQTQKQYEQNRLCVYQEEIQQFWQSRTLQEMQQILTIKQQKLIQHIWQYFNYYLNNRKSFSNKEAYYICKVGKSKHNTQIINNSSFNSGGSQEGHSGANSNYGVENNNNYYIDDNVLMYCYDCKIFKSTLFSREDNQMLSCFMLRFKSYEGQLLTDDGKPLQIYEFLNSNLYSNLKTIIKCKSSCLLKIYPLFKQLHLQPLKGDVAIMPQQYYYRFIYNWTHFSHSWEVQPMVKHLFRGFMILLQNQIALQFSRSLSQKQKQSRRYQRPVALYQKPKLKQTYTMVQQQLGDVEWNTLKISAFKLKYRVIEDEKKFLCYRVKDEDSFDLNMHLKMQQLQQQDQKILMAFDKLRGNWQEAEF